MASHKSAIKRAKQNDKRRLRNTSIRSNIKTEIKAIIQAVEKRDGDNAKTALALAIPKISKAAAKGVFHKKNAARKISRLTLKVNALSS